MPERLQPSEYLVSPRKPAFDRALTTAAKPVVVPLEAVAKKYLSTVLDDGDVYYEHERYANGKLVLVKKLRTMINGGPTDEEVGFTKDNPRIPNRMVKLLRDTGIDELPQIQQVHDGELSLVGPRPRPDEMNQYIRRHLNPTTRFKWDEVIEITQGGLTGKAQLMHIGRDDRGEQWANETAAADIWYAEHASLKLDICILRQTVIALGNHAVKKLVPQPVLSTSDLMA